MNITPLEIRQKAFTTQFRGYDKEEVDAFLLSMSQEWERINLQMRDQTMKIESADKELQKLREVESSLFKTLKTAEDTSSNLIEQANRSAELQIKESQMNAEALIGDARVLAKDMIEEAEMAIKNSYDLMNSKLKDLEADYKAIESARSNLLDELRGLATNILDKAERSEEKDFKLDRVEKVTGSITVKEITAPLDTAFSNINNTRIDRDLSKVNKPDHEEKTVEFVVSNDEAVSKDEEPGDSTKDAAEIKDTAEEVTIKKKSFFDED